MTSLVFIAVLFLGVGCGVFAGLLICANVETGDFVFTDLRRDVLKCVAMAVVIAAAGVGLSALSRDARVFLALPPLWYVALRVCWLELQMAEVAVAGASCFLWLGAVSSLTRALFRS